MRAAKIIKPIEYCNYKKLFPKIAFILFLLIAISLSNSAESRSNNSEVDSKRLSTPIYNDLKENNDKANTNGNLSPVLVTNGNGEPSNFTMSNTTLREKGRLPAAQMQTDWGILTILALAGVALFIFRLLQKSQNFAKSLIQMEYKIKPKKNPFIGLDGQDFNSIASNTSKNLSTLSATYGILLSFIIAVKIDVVFQSWAFYVWVGILVSIIVRSLSVSIRLSDLAYVSKINYPQKVAYLLYSKALLKHSTYAFIIIIAFTPIFAFFGSQNINTVERYDYLGPYLMLTAALSVIAVTLFFVFVSSTIPKELHLFYLYIISPLAIITFFLTNSPLDPIKIEFFSDSYIIPSITMPILLVGLLFFAVIFSMNIQYYVFRYWDKRKARKTERG